MTVRKVWLSITVPVLVIAAAGVWTGFEGAVPEDEPATSRVIEVQMLDDGGEMRFEPESIEVRRGDVVRFVQRGMMPHNVEFVRNTAPDGVDLDDLWSGGYLTARAETYDVEIDDRFADGRYDYICAPHAALGMKGSLTVRGGDASALESAAVRLASTGAAGSAGASPVEPLPLVEGEAGAREIEYELDGDVKVFRMTVERIEWQTREGKNVEAWAFNRQVPGPTIRVDEGDRVRIVVTNQLPENTTTHWHGLDVPNAMDGVPGITQDPIEPGDSFAYEFVAKPAGTRLYHSHFNSLHQEEHGLYGMFIVEPEVEEPALRADREFKMIMGDGPLGFVINGKEFPAVAPMEVRKGERIRVRMANLGGLYHPMHMHGGHFEVVAKDGYPVPQPQAMNTISLEPGSTYDVVLEPTETGTWLWHCHVLSHVTGPKDENGQPTVAGMVGVVEVSEDEPDSEVAAGSR